MFPSLLEKRISWLQMLPGHDQPQGLHVEQHRWGKEQIAQRSWVGKWPEQLCRQLRVLQDQQVILQTRNPPAGQPMEPTQSHLRPTQAVQHPERDAGKGSQQTRSNLLTRCRKPRQGQSKVVPQGTLNLIHYPIRKGLAHGKASIPYPFNQPQIFKFSYLFYCNPLKQKHRNHPKQV